MADSSIVFAALIVASAMVAVPFIKRKLEMPVPQKKADIIAKIVQAEANFTKLVDSEAAAAVAPVQKQLDDANAEIASLKQDDADSTAAMTEAVDKLVHTSETTVAAPVTPAPADTPPAPVADAPVPGTIDPVTGLPVA